MVTPQIVLAANLLVYSNLSEFEMDLGNAILRIDRIDSNLAISLSASGELNVSRFHAKHASLIFKPQESMVVDKQATMHTLPSRIDLPLPIALQQGLIDELVIQQANETSTIKAITFNLHANQQSLRLALQVGESPWGQLQTEVDMQNQKPFAITGWLTAEQANASTPYQLKAELSGNLAQLHLHALHHYQPESDTFTIVPATSTQQTNLIALDAEVSLQDQMPASLQIQLKALNTAYIHPQLAGQLNLSLLANGTLSGQQPMQVVLESNNSEINQHPLTLNGQATLVDFVLTHLDVNAALANNQFKLSGGLNPNDSSHNTLRWLANLPALDQVMAGFSGNIQGNGEIKHTDNHYDYQYALEGTQLNLPSQLHIDQINAKGQFSTIENNNLESSVTIRGLTNGDPEDIDTKPIHAKLNLSGTLLQHQLTLDIENADPQDASFGLTSSIDGSVNAGSWQGAIRHLASKDANTFQLARPAPMTFSPSAGFTLKDLLLIVGKGQVHLDNLIYQPSQRVDHATKLQKAIFKTEGRIQQLPLQTLQDYMGLSNPNVAHDLTLNGHWQIEAADTVNATISLNRESGDILLQDTIEQSKQAMGLSTLAFNLKVVNNQITADTQLQSSYAGALQANMRTALTSTPHGFILSQQAPFTLHAEANLQHLNWLTLHDADTSIDGQLSLLLDANGTIAAPALSGFIRGLGLSVAIPSQGIALSDGVLDATFSGETLTVKQLDFNGKTGTLNAQGQANFIQRPVQLALKVQANRLTALSRTDRFLVLSGDGDMNVNGERALINGQFKVHHGLFELPKAGKPTLDDDIIIVGKENQQTPTKLGLALGALSIDFGNRPLLPYDESRQFILRGQGLNGALSGKVTLSGSLPQLEAVGTLDVIGTYMAYGQLLTIETGQINLSGPISNAGLNIVAMRNLQPTKVGVKLTGDIKTPQLKLVSEPEKSNDDKLSLLVLGRPMSEAGNSELALLSVAAGALLSQGDSVPLQSRIANLAGLDSLDIKGSSATDYSVNVGKRINRQLTIGYEKSIFGLLNVAKLTYQLTRRIAIETKAGSENALDVVYSFSFD
jgi:translocation and assembly module TamB